MPPIYQSGAADIVIEAEDHDSANNRNGTSWAISSSPTGAVGSHIVASGSYTTATGWATTAAYRSYDVYFATAGTYYLHARMYATGSGDNSFSVGINTSEPSSGYNVQTTTYNAWSWANTGNASAIVTLNVPSAGLHTIALYVREATCRIDRIVLTTSSSATYSGTGPAATPRQNPPSTGTWKKLTQKNPFNDRRRRVQLGLSSGAAEGYLGVQLPDGTLEFYAGPLAADGVTLTLVANQAAAEAAPVAIPASGVWRLPAVRETRRVTLYRRSSGAYNLHTFYARTLISADDVDAQNLRALATETGDLLVTGVLTINPAGGMYSGTGTFAAPQTGIKQWTDQAGVGRWATYRNGIAQVEVDSQGRVTWAAGRAWLDATGTTISVPPNGSQIEELSYTLRQSSNNRLVGYLTAYGDDTGGTGHGVELSTGGGTTAAGQQRMMVRAVGTNGVVRTFIVADGPGGYAETVLESSGSTTNYTVNVRSIDLNAIVQTRIRRPLILYNSGTNSSSTPDAYTFATSTPTTGTRLLTVSGGPQRWHGLATTDHPMLLRAPQTGMIPGTDNGAALYLGGDVLGSATTPTAAIECSWGGTFTPQIAIGVVRDGVKANILMDYGGTTRIRNASGVIATFAGGGQVGIGGDPTSDTILNLRGWTNDATAYTLSMRNANGAYHFWSRNDGAHYLKQVGVNRGPNSDTSLSINGLGTSSATFSFAAKDGAGTNVLWARDDGVVFTRSGTVTASDRAYKRDIATIDPTQARAVLAALPLRRYQRHSSDRIEYGVIAQELATIAPELVMVADDGRLAVDYPSLCILLLAALQPLIAA